MKKRLWAVVAVCIVCMCIFVACASKNKTEEEHVHDVTCVSQKDATCFEDGNIAYWYCEACEKYFADENCEEEIALADTVKAKHHTPDKKAAKEADCFNDGNIACWYCASCEKYFEDENCAKEIDKEDVTISKLAHKNAEFIDREEAKCEEAGNIEYWFCVDCGLYFSDDTFKEVLDHVEISPKKHASKIYHPKKTDTVTGDERLAYFSCPDCGKSFIDENCTLEVDPDQLVIQTALHFGKNAADTYTVTSCDTGVENVIIPDVYNGLAVTGISVGAFKGNHEMKSIVIGKNIKTIGSEAFSGCTGLTQIEFNATACNNFTKYNKVFYDAGSKGNGIAVIFGKNVTKVPAYLFYAFSENNPKIASVTFADEAECTAIGEYAFYGSSAAFAEITVPEKVKTIGNSAFYGCSSLKNIYFNAINCNDLILQNRAFYFDGKGDAAVVFGASVEKVPAYLFGNAGMVASVKFADGKNCENIGAGAFYGCGNLKELTLPEGLKEVGSDAFYMCNNVDRINYDAVDFGSSDIIDLFSYVGIDADSISVFIGETVQKIPANMFSHKKVSTVTFIGDSECTEIGDGAFYGCSKLTFVEFEDSSKCVTIGDGAFGLCTCLASITIPESVVTVGDRAFKGCSLLETVEFGGNSACENIGAEAFADCVKLTEIDVPNDALIGEDAFLGCEKLK